MKLVQARNTTGAIGLLALISVGGCGSSTIRQTTSNASPADAAADSPAMHLPPGCEAGSRFAVGASQTWDATVNDRETGLTWRRGYEHNSTLPQCDGTTHAAGSEYCCSIGDVALCTWTAAKSYCSARSMRLPSEAELLAITGENSPVCAFDADWGSWSATPAGSATAWYVHALGDTHELDTGGYYYLRCVR